MATLEISERQADEVADDIAAELERQGFAEGQHDPFAQRARDGAERIDQSEADQQDGEQADVALADRLVDGELDVEGRQQRGQLQQQGESEDLDEGAAIIGKLAPRPWAGPGCASTS